MRGAEKKRRGVRVLRPAGAVAVYDGEVYVADFPLLFRHGRRWIAVPEADEKIVVGKSLRGVLRRAGMRRGDLVLVDRRRPPFRTTP